MQDEQLPANNQENEKPVIRKLPRKLSRKHKAFADAYLLTLNASEAYRIVYKLENPESAYKNAYRVLNSEGVRRYVDEALLESSEANYRPEAIKEGILNLAKSSRRESDRLRAYEIMAKISGLLTDQTQQQVNVFTSDIMDLARKRLSERKELSKSQNVTISESSEVIESKEDTASMSYNNCYVPSPSESVLSINEDSSVGKADAKDSSDNSMGQDEGGPVVGGDRTPTHPSKYV